MPSGILADYLRIADLLEEFGPSLRMPHSKALSDGLFELRANGREGIGRVFYCFLIGQQVVVLHGFVKKTQEPPPRVLYVGVKRMKEVKKSIPPGN
ncbi:MAG: type II toxin-antitoxin system RelE/ParE family toxin [Desulfobulbaceae bacterium]